MIVEKHPQQPTPQIVTEKEAWQINPLTEAYKAVKTILSQIHVDDDDTKPLLFKTIKIDHGQLARIKNKKENSEFALGFPAVLIHFINVYYNVGQYDISQGKGTMRIHYILNTLNNSDDEVETEGFKVYQQINSAIQANKDKFPELVSRFQLSYWDQPLSFDEGLQPYWIDYDIWFTDYSAYRYKDYVLRKIVIPPFTDHSDQLLENRPEHSDHTTNAMDNYASVNELNSDS